MGPVGGINTIVANAIDVMLAGLADVISAQFHFQRDVSVVEDFLGHDMKRMAILAGRERYFPRTQRSNDVNEVVWLDAHCLFHRLPQFQP